MVRINAHALKPGVRRRAGLPAPPPAAPARPGASPLLGRILSVLPLIAGRLDAAGAVREVEGAGLARFGIPAGEIVGARLPAALPDLAPRFQAALAGETVNFHWEGTVQGELCHLEVFFFPTGNREEDEPGVFFFIRDLTENKKLEREVLAISEAEQQRIGADLHDGLGQHLTGIACLASALANRLRTSGGPEKGEADEIARLVQEAISQTRALARGLSPVQVEDYGLQSALESLAYEVERLHRIECRFEGGAALPVYDHAVAVNLYRIAQEAINNALKHGAPSRITVRLRLDARKGLLAVEDNGKGFSAGREPGRRGSLGLRIMGYRASVIGGTLEVSSRPREGTVIQCQFPNPS